MRKVSWTDVCRVIFKLTAPRVLQTPIEVQEVKAGDDSIEKKFKNPSRFQVNMLDHLKCILFISAHGIFLFSERLGRTSARTVTKWGTPAALQACAKQALRSPQWLQPVLQTQNVWTNSRFASRTRPNL